MIENRKGCSKTGNDVLKRVNPKIKFVTQPNKFFFKQKSSLKLFFITHTFDSGGFFTFLLDLAHGAPWARVANFVKKPALIANATYLELNDFNTSMWFS
jgi:hypothetical protein